MSLTITFTVNDLPTNLFNGDVDAAQEWLDNNSKQLRDSLTQHGNTTLDVFLSMDFDDEIIWDDTFCEPSDPFDEAQALTRLVKHIHDQPMEVWDNNALRADLMQAFNLQNTGHNTIGLRTYAAQAFEARFGFVPSHYNVKKAFP